MRLKNKSWFLSIFFIIPHISFCVKSEIIFDNLAIAALQHGDIVQESIVVDNPHFKSYVISLVENALQDNAQEQLSNGLLNCYEQVCKDEKEFLVERSYRCFS